MDLLEGALGLGLALVLGLVLAFALAWSLARVLRLARRRALAITHLGHQFVQLDLGVAPLLHSCPGQEMLFAQALEFAPREMPAFIVQEGPEVQEAEEIRIRMAEGGMDLIGRLLLFERSLARILHRQRGGDDGQLAQAMVLGAGEQHAADARIDRQARELLADRGELALAVDRRQLLQCPIAIRDQP